MVPAALPGRGGADGGPRRRRLPALLARFEEGLRAAAALGEDPAALGQRLVPAIEFPPMAAYTRGDALVHIAQHNSHHLGQVVSARQFLELWPPRAGGWTW
jgi:uncharacterized damage-inducible protein DinB